MGELGCTGEGKGGGRPEGKLSSDRDVSQRNGRRRPSDAASGRFL